MRLINQPSCFSGALRLWLLAVLLLLAWPTAGNAREVRLQAGESFHEGDLTVTCEEQGAGLKPIQLTECQYWDDFKKTCLFEKKIHVYKDIQCVEECRQWDDFKDVCHYRTSCRFYPEQQSFVKTDCLEFDGFHDKCLRSGEEIVGRAGQGRRP